jgi:hypothetical protein
MAAHCGHEILRVFFPDIAAGILGAIAAIILVINNTFRPVSRD